MAILNVTTLLQNQTINNLEVKVPILQLSDKRITTSVRKYLQNKFGNNTKVSCSTLTQNGKRIGSCQINNKTYQFDIS